MSQNAKVAFFTLRDSYIEDGKCFHDSSNSRLIDDLSKHYKNFTFVTYQDKRRKPYYNHEIKVSSIFVLPFENTFFNGLFKSFYVFKLLKKIEEEHDVIILQFPFKTFFAPLFIRKPIVAHVCSNLLSAANNPVKYKGLSRAVSVFYARVFHFFNKLIFRRSNVQVITNGKELASLYQTYNPQMIVSSSIYRDEIISIDEIKKRDFTFKILFVGRPSLEKGFDTLLAAFRSLLKVYDVELLCVGFTEHEFNILYSINVDDINSKMRFLGAIPFSEALFNIYRSADVLILPSRSEGTPRVLVEARAFGCPVIATRVGGIPDSINQDVDGLLFEVGDTAGLINLVKDLIQHEDKRIQLAIQGIKRVKEMTVERFSDTFVTIINQRLHVKE